MALSGSPVRADDPVDGPDRTRVRGTCSLLFAFDVGFEIDLEAADDLLSHPGTTGPLRYKRRAPEAGSPHPVLRFSRQADPVRVRTHQTLPELGVSLYGFGGMCLTYEIELDLDLEQLVALSAELYDNRILQGAARDHAVNLLQVVKPSVKESGLSEIMEDYVVFQIDGPGTTGELAPNQSDLIARILRAEPERLSREEIEGALSTRLSYGCSDLTIIDWFAAILVGEGLEDELRVLELTTVELLEMRLLDRVLENRIVQAYDALAKATKMFGSLALAGKELERIGRMQADCAVVLEGVDNPLKLVGDDYLARFYRAASERFHFPEWEALITRKQSTLDEIYKKLTDRAARRRSEVLEWIIIILIAMDIVLYFTPLR